MVWPGFVLDREAASRPSTIHTSCARILKQLELPAPDGQSRRDGATLAGALFVSDDAV